MSAEENTASKGNTASDDHAQPGDSAAERHTPTVTSSQTQASTDSGIPGWQLFGLRESIPQWLSWSAAVLCIGLCFALWWFATYGPNEERLLSPLQLTAPGETLDRLPLYLDAEAPQRHLINNIWVSLKRVVVGFGLAVLVGVPLGVAAGCFPLVRGFLSPLILFGRNIPVAALTAVAFAFFGTGELQRVMFIFFACVAFIVADTIDAIREVSQRYVETAFTIGASRLQAIFKVLIPLSMPSVFNSLRVMFGLAFGYIMLVEIVHEDEGAGGLGFLLNQSQARGGGPEIMVIILLTIPMVAFVIDQMLYVLQCWLFRWKYGKEAEQSAPFRMSRALLRLFWSRA